MESVFLGFFLFGFLMVLASLALGFAHMALPGLEGALHGGDGGAHTGGDGALHDGGSHGPLLWNVSTLLAFLMWFGAAGYAAMRWLNLPAPVALLPAIGIGLVGGFLVSSFLRVVLRGETVMNPSAYRMEGTLARVTISIPPDGTGEIVFSKGERRRSEGARSLDGQPIARGEEVVVVEYQRGIALVQRWQDFVGNA
jgi:membrane protein implicated in regulation of membrane protease activity